MEHLLGRNERVQVLGRAVLAMLRRCANWPPRPWRSATTYAARWTLCGPQEWWYKCAGQEQLRSEIVLYEKSLDRCAKVLTDMTRLNLEDRLVIVTERWAEVVVSVIRSILAAVGTDPDDGEVRTIVQRNLRAVGA